MHKCVTVLVGDPSPAWQSADDMPQDSQPAMRNPVIVGSD